MNRQAFQVTPRLGPARPGRRERRDPRTRRDSGALSPDWSSFRGLPLRVGERWGSFRGKGFRCRDGPQDRGESPVYSAGEPGGLPEGTAGLDLWKNPGAAARSLLLKGGGGLGVGSRRGASPSPLRALPPSGVHELVFGLDGRGLAGTGRTVRRWPRS